MTCEKRQNKSGFHNEIDEKVLKQAIPVLPIACVSYKSTLVHAGK